MFPVEGSFYDFHANGEYVLTGMFRDISERKQLEEKLRESEERARVLLNAPPDVAILVDDKGKIIDCNEGLCLRMHRIREELIGKNPLDLLDKDVTRTRNKFFKKALAEKTPVYFQDMSEGKWFDHSVNPILDTQGKVTQLVIFAHEITELKQKEEEIERTRDKLKALAMEVTTIEENTRRSFSNYLHDRIGQTLFVLKIRLEMMAQAGAGSERSEKWKEIFTLMEKAINDTRTLSYEMSPSILNELGLEAALEWLVDRNNKEHDIIISFQSDRRPTTIDAHICTILYRAVRELLINVVKHASAKHVSISLQQEDHRVQLEIKDDGVGFDVESLKFLPDHNKGFGLFSIKERLQWYNGDMMVTSVPGRGTHITILAPVKQ